MCDKACTSNCSRPCTCTTIKVMFTASQHCRRMLLYKQSLPERSSSVSSSLHSSSTSSLLQPVMLSVCSRGHCRITWLRKGDGITHVKRDSNSQARQGRPPLAMIQPAISTSCYPWVPMELHPTFTAVTLLSKPQLLRLTCVRLLLCTSTYSKPGQLLRLRDSKDGQAPCCRMSSMASIAVCCHPQAAFSRLP